MKRTSTRHAARLVLGSREHRRRGAARLRMLRLAHFDRVSRALGYPLLSWQRTLLESAGMLDEHSFRPLLPPGRSWHV